ncbi:MAG: outer membrane protein transport protein [Proteobacteria bacterium]|nr:outer membrane protein transport protein [Pseudomonadota bacterium]
MARNWDTTNKTKIAILSSSLVFSCLSSQVFASGFALLEQNVTNLGLAYSGTAALAEDASTGYYNPAGLTRLGESEVVLSGILIQGDFDLTATATSSFNPAFPINLTPFAVRGSNEDNPGTLNFVPTFHLSKRIDDRWIFGFNVTTPFGLNTHYDEDSIARYLATNSKLQTVDFSPSIAYEFSPCFAVGFGADALWGKAILEARTGTGTVATDGFQKNHAEGWGYGWHAGVLWTPRLSTRLGITYRSHINYHAEGNSESLVPLINGTIFGFGPAEGTYTLNRVRSHLTFPETWTASLFHCFTDQFAVTADAAWTNWSRVHTLRLRFEPNRGLPIFAGNLPVDFTSGIDTDTWEHFKDSRRVALGLVYTHDANWLFRIGTAYDQSPIRDEFRTARLPDEDRVWVALGGAFTVNEAFRIDFGYAHLFFDDASINERAPFIAGSDTPITHATLKGEYKGSADLVGIQIRYDFV